MVVNQNLYVATTKRSLSAAKTSSNATTSRIRTEFTFWKTEACSNVLSTIIDVSFTTIQKKERINW
jgi:hypothetical protein